MKKEVKLNVAISILVILVVIIATVIELVSSTNALKTSLTTSYLENNYTYTNKLAETVTYVTSDLQQSMVAMANLSRYPDFGQSHIDILFESEKEHFNSIFMTDEKGIIQLISPKIAQFQDRESSIKFQKGSKIATNIINKAISTKQPFLSEPYIDASGFLLILVTVPVVNESGVFQGLMAGTLNLEDANSMNTVFGSNKYIDGSYVYAVDQSGRIVYHPDEEKIYENVSDNLIVRTVAEGESGYQITKENGTEYFAGYSHIESLGWGVILLTPTSILHEPLNNLVSKIITQSILILLILLILATIFGRRLTNPLTILAEYSERLVSNKKLTNSNDELIINSRIYEINQLYRQIRIQLLRLNQEIQLDGLTGIANRKAYDAIINDWVEQRQPFALVMLDIDNFKRINDTYGHLTGDDVIKFLASILISFSKEEDISFRYGGEEFGLLLKGKDEEEALSTAEQIRVKIASQQSPTGRPITVSIGVTSIQENDESPKVIIDRADKALYQSKQSGKNRVTVYRHD